MQNATFQSLSLAACVVWAQNPRRTVGDLTELVESVRSVGVLEPVLARPAGDGWEILAGQRRFLAAGLAGLTEVPALVRDVPDDVALELALAENANREGVAPLEEAEAIERLVRDHGRSVADVAARLGRSVRWVERRRMLLNLTAESRAWCEQLAVPLAHMESLSAVGTAAQARVVERLRYIREPKGIPAHAYFARMVAEQLHDLAGAPFALDDVGLGGRGPCGTCPMRSDRQQSLFDAAPQGARCLDDGCWSTKVDALWERAQKDAKRRKLKVVDVKEVGHDWSPGALQVNWDSPWVTKAPTKDAKPAAITRGARGHVYELYAKPAVASKPAAQAATQGDDDSDEEADEEADRETENLYEKRRAEREAAEVERLSKLYALTADPATTEAFLRSAIAADASEHGTVTARRVAKIAGVELGNLHAEALAEALPAAQLWRVLLTCMCETRLADVVAVDNPAAWERPLLARLAAPAVPGLRVWIAEAAWDALPTDEREGLEEPVGGAPLHWEGREGWVTAAVPGELLSTVRGLAEAAGVTLHEGDEEPAREAPAAPAAEVNLRVKRSVWQQHRSGLQDSAKGLLHKEWRPEGEDRVATVARGSDAHSKVSAYATQHGLDVRVGGAE